MTMTPEQRESQSDLESAARKLTEDEYDAVQHRGYRLGQVVALEGTAASLSTQSGTLYAAKQDERARWMREVAEKIHEEAAAARARYHQDYP